MTGEESVLNKKRFQHLLQKYITIILGCVLYAIGFRFFLYPNNITSGGVVGTAMIVNQLTGLPVGVMTILLNVPLFLIAWRHFGLDFLIGSLAGMGLSSVLVDAFAGFGIMATDDPMLAAVIGGVIKGAGLGIIYYVGDDDQPLKNEEVILSAPQAPAITGFRFVEWQVQEGSLTDGITLRAVYKADIPSSAPAVYTNPANPAQKLIKNGNVYILTDDKTYSIDGRQVR